MCVSGTLKNAVVVWVVFNYLLPGCWSSKSSRNARSRPQIRYGIAIWSSAVIMKQSAFNRV